MSSVLQGWLKLEELFFCLTVLFLGIQHTHMIPFLSSNPTKGGKGCLGTLHPATERRSSRSDNKLVALVVKFRLFSTLEPEQQCSYPTWLGRACASPQHQPYEHEPKRHIQSRAQALELTLGHPRASSDPLWLSA